MYTTGKGCQIHELPIILEKFLGFKTDGRFVEVGAFDGSQWSNTYGLACIGWKGIAIEPHPEFNSRCNQIHKSHNVKVLRLAISNYEGEGELYLAGSLSTLYNSTVIAYRGMEWSSYLFPDDIKTFNVRVTTLDTCLEEERWEPDFDLLVIDVEGGELEVLKGFSIDHWRPKMMIIETHAEYPDRCLNYKGRVIGTMLDFYGYREVYADTINSIYVKRGG